MTPSNERLSNGRQIGLARWRRTMLTLCLLCLSSSGMLGCQTALWGKKADTPVFVPGTRKIESVKAGDPSPIDGFVIPPAVMVEIGPYLAEALKGDQAKWFPTPADRQAARDAIAAPNPRDAVPK